MAYTKKLLFIICVIALGYCFYHHQDSNIIVRLFVEHKHQSAELAKIIRQLGNYSDKFMASDILFYHVVNNAVHAVHTSKLPAHTFKPSNNWICRVKFFEVLHDIDWLCTVNSGKLGDLTDSILVGISNTPVNWFGEYPYILNGDACLVNGELCINYMIDSHYLVRSAAGYARRSPKHNQNLNYRIEFKTETTKQNRFNTNRTSLNNLSLIDFFKLVNNI